MRVDSPSPASADDAHAQDQAAREISASGDANARAHPILLVTGLSGAGKTTALQVLEDMGWETIDNFPIRLLRGLVRNSDESEDPVPLAIGFDSRTRGFVTHDIITKVKSLRQQGERPISTLFIDCSDGELERRYNETRRRHPMAGEQPVLAGIGAERAILEPLRQWADAVIDTSAFTSNQLQQAIRENYNVEAPQEMTITISSFGFARGAPPLADLLFDMRFLDNPYWVEDLRELTGQDEPVGKHIEADPAFAQAFGQIVDLLLTLLPRYEAQNRSYVNIAFGCTGGRHRSVYSARKMANCLRDAGFAPTVIHRNLESHIGSNEGRKK